VAHHHRPDAVSSVNRVAGERVTLGYKGRVLPDISTTQGSAHSA
jgi:hypothetical protein